MRSGPVAVIIFPKDVSSINYNDIKQALPSFVGFSLSIVHNGQRECASKVFILSAMKRTCFNLGDEHIENNQIY